MEFANNLNVENQNISNSSAASSAGQTSSASQSENTSIMAKPKKELLEKLGISEAEYIELYSEYPEFPSLPVEKQLELIKSKKNDTGANSASGSSNTENTPETQQAANSDDIDFSRFEKNGVFDHAAFSKLSIEEKYAICLEELAKNTFLYSDKNNPKTLEEWNALSDAEKQQYKDRVRSFLQEKLEGISFKKLKEDEKLSSRLLNTLMTNIAVANDSGLSAKQYFGLEPAIIDGKEVKIDETYRKELTYNYYKDVKAYDAHLAEEAQKNGETAPASHLSKADEIEYERQNFEIEALRYLTGSDEDFSPEDVNKYLKDNLTTHEEFQYKYLRAKESNEGLTDKETKIYNNLSKIVNNPNYQATLEQYKVSMLESLKKEKETCTDAERIAEIDKILNSDEAKAIEQNANPKYKPDNTKELKEFNNFKNSPYGKLYEQADSGEARASLIIAYVDSLDKKDQKNSGIYREILAGLRAEGDPASMETALELQAHAVRIFSGRNQKRALKDSSSNETAVAQSRASEGELTDEERANVSAATQIVGEKQQREYEEAGTTQSREVVIANINAYQEFVADSDVIVDEDKLGYIENTGKVNKEPSVGNGNFNIAVTIENSNSQLEAISKIHENASTETLVFGATNSYRLNPDNQVSGAKLYAEGCPDAIKAFVGEGTASKFAASEQVEGFKLGNSLVENEESFNEDEKIELLEKSSDYVSDADAENQAEIHDIFAKSKYSEVQEHAASNIYKYHESAQAKALNSTLESGNKKAADNAMSNMDKYADDIQKNPKYLEAQRESEVRKAQETAQIIADFHQQYEKITGLKSNIDSKFSDDEIKLTYVKEFLNSTPQEQFRMITKVPMSWQGAIFSKIAAYCPQMLSSLVKQGYGKSILSTPGLETKVVYKIINLMLQSSGSDRKAAAKFVKEHSSMFSNSTIEKVNEITLKDNNFSKTNQDARLLFIKTALKPAKSEDYPHLDEMDVYNA